MCRLPEAREGSSEVREGSSEVRKGSPESATCKARSRRDSRDLTHLSNADRESPVPPLLRAVLTCRDQAYGCPAVKCVN
ncbi:hypothetical protein RJT34_22561 [Clitoria ternatea]|uniref:Uncharacterized protein n=1 Tax=Clitoria ternatea TaxID=43366 RepID=A0AAN9FMJ8_CLITE